MKNYLNLAPTDIVPAPLLILPHPHAECAELHAASTRAAVRMLLAAASRQQALPQMITMI